MRTPIMVSKRGLVLQYIENDAVYQDGEAGYVDDILDCFDTWDGTGTLQGFIKSQFAKELASFSTPDARAMAALQPDMVEGARMVLEAKIKLIAGEPEDALVNMRLAYRRNPKQTIGKMLAAAKKHSGGRYISTEVRRQEQNSTELVWR